jgi:hypothetical protein
MLDEVLSAPHEQDEGVENCWGNSRVEASSVKAC